MPLGSILRGATAASALIVAQPALAEVTPGEVWDDIAAYMQGFGYAVTATEAMSGDTLVVRDVRMTLDMPEEQSRFAFLMSELRLAPTGDGAVSVTFPATMPIEIVANPPDDDDVEMTLDYTQQGLELIVSGDETELVYDYSADSLGIRLSRLVVEGQPVGPEIARFDATMAPVSGSSVVSISGDGTRSIEQSVSLGDIVYDLAVNDPDSDEAGLFTGTYSGVTADGTSVIPPGVAGAEIGALMASGMAGTGTISHQGGVTEFAVTEGSGTTNGRATSSSGRMAVSFDAEALGYEVSATDATFDMSGPELPLPISARMAETSFNLTMPVTASETPQEIAFGATLGGFTMSDLIWNVFDPGKVLPRDPATVSIDVIGEATPFVNFFDADAMAALEDSDDVPGELNALTLRDLTVEMAGARIDGDGAFTFDNSDTETFDGLPRPTGAIELRVEGANGLIDKLIQMGLLAEEDAMGARMMLSMFAVPAGDDTLNSRIEINEQGHVLANGQRIQ